MRNIFILNIVELLNSNSDRQHFNPLKCSENNNMLQVFYVFHIIFAQFPKLRFVLLKNLILFRSSGKGGESRGWDQAVHERSHWNRNGEGREYRLQKENKTNKKKTRLLFQYSRLSMKFFRVCLARCKIEEETANSVWHGIFWCVGVFTFPHVLSLLLLVCTLWTYTISSPHPQQIDIVLLTLSYTKSILNRRKKRTVKEVCVMLMNVYTPHKSHFSERERWRRLCVFLHCASSNNKQS